MSPLPVPREKPTKNMLPLLFYLVLLHSWHLSSARIFTLEMHHFSDPIKNWSRRRAADSDHNWPEKGSLEYYQELAKCDRLLRGRHLSKFDGPLTFSDANFIFCVSWIFALYNSDIGDSWSIKLEFDSVR